MFNSSLEGSITTACLQPLPSDSGAVFLPKENRFDFPIALISAKGEFHQNKKKLQQEIELLHRMYSDSTFPVVYIFGDSVYKNAKVSEDELARAKASWQRKYDDAIFQLQQKGENTKEILVFWDAVKNDESYTQIKVFVDAVFDPSVSIDSLARAFPNIQTQGVLEQLLEKVQSLNLVENLIKITEEFKKKNLLPLAKKEKKEHGKRKKEEALDKLINSKIAILTNIDEQLLNVNETVKQPSDVFQEQTLAFLKEEYAVFMNLYLPSTFGQMIEKCGLNIDNIDLLLPIRPVLHYPITPTKGSLLIFETFRLIERIYIEYCGVLDLPLVSSPVCIMDVIVPDDVTHDEEKKISSDNEELEIACNQKADIKTILPASNIAEQSLVQPLMPYVVPKSAFYQPPVITTEIRAIASKIVELINDFLITSDKEIQINTQIEYRNGIDCDISVNTTIHINENGVNHVHSNPWILIGENIERAIYHVKTDLVSINININYLGYPISLSMRPPQASLKFS